MNYCPQCNSIKKWHFSEGESASSIWDRFDKVNPDTGCCDKCGFRYSEHAFHPLEEQLENFRKRHQQEIEDEIYQEKGE